MRMILFGILVLVVAGSLCAQEELSSELEVHTYRELLDSELGAVESLNAVVFRPGDGPLDSSEVAVVVFHGGGWSMGSGEWAYGTALHFAELGLVGIAINYRLSDQLLTSPVDAMADARAAIRWTRENAEMLRVSPDKIVAYGWSAGAHLAMSAAIFSEMEPRSDTSSVPNALVLKSPALDLVNDKWFCTLLGDSLGAADYSPVEHVRAGLPPTLILQGDTDTVTPVAGVKKFRDRMIAAGNRCELVVYEKVGHLFTPAGEPDDRYPNPDPKTQAAAWREVENFLESLGYLAD